MITWDATYQVVANALVTSAAVVLVALGFALIYLVGRFFHFAHAAVYTWAAYSAFVCVSYLHLSLGISSMLAVCSATLLGCLIETTVYRPLRHRNTSPLAFLLASLGFYVVVQNCISLVFGDDTKRIHSRAVDEGIAVLGARLTWVQVSTIFVSILLLLVVWFVLRRTKVGRAIRAAADDPELARASGIDLDRLILWTVILGSALAGVAGTLSAWDVAIVPSMGINALFLGVVVVVVGGARSLGTMALAAVGVALAWHIGAWILGGEWKDTIVFAILLAFFFLRSHGVVRLNFGQSRA